MAEESLFVRIRATGKEAIDEFRKVGAEAEESSKKQQSGWAKASKGIQLAGAAIAGVAVAIAVKSVEMADKYEVSHARLETALRNSHTSWEEQSKAINAVSDASTRFGYTKTDVEDALATMTTGMGSAQKAMANFQLVEDLSAKTGKPLSDSAIAITKASEGMLRPLKQMGIDLPIAAGGALKTKTSMEALGKAQDKMKATLEAMHSGLLKGPAAMHAYQSAQSGLQTAQQKFNDTSSSGTDILAALGQKLSGSASAQADTFGGKVKAMKAELSNVEITIGMKLIPVLTKMLGWLQDGVTWFSKGGTGATALKVAIAALAGVIVLYNVGLVAVKAATIVTTVATHAWTAAQWLLNLAMDANPIGLIVLGIAGLTVGIIALIKHLGGAKQTVIDFWIGLKAIGSFMAKLPGIILGAIGDIETKMFQVGVAIVQGILNGIGDIGSTLLHKVTSGLGGLVHGVKSFLGIASPSRVFYELGSNTMQGFVLGMGAQETWAVAAAKTTLSKVIATIRGGQSAIRSAMDAIGAGGRTVAGGRLDIQDARRNLAQAKNDLPTYGFAVKDAQAQLDADKKAGADAETLQKDEIALADARLNLSQGSEAVKRAELALADARATEKSNVQSLAAAHGDLASKMKHLKDIFTFLAKEHIVTPTTVGWGAHVIGPTPTHGSHTTNVNVHLHGTNIGTTKEFQDAVIRALRQAGATKNQSSNYGQQVQFA